MKLSCIIVTHNRRQTLLKTLDHLERTVPLAEHDWEILVVDNGSTDGTADAISRRRRVRVISLAENEGVPARNLALAAARGKYVAILDDATHPIDQTIPKALAYLCRNPRTAAVCGRVVLPDGSCEAPALPAVLMGGASIMRKAVLDEVGGFAAEFFRQAADYELSFRIWNAGHSIERFEDLCFARDEGPPARPSELSSRMGLRNNLILCERYLPRPLRHAYRRDWLRRYSLMAQQGGHAAAARTAMKEARIWARREAAVGRKMLSPTAIEAIFRLQAQREAVAAWAQERQIKRVCIADWGKNLYATWNACCAAGLNVSGILENAPAFQGALYREIPVVPDAEFKPGSADGILISTINPAQLEARAAELESRFSVPVLRLWKPTLMSVPPPRRLPSPAGQPSRKIERAA